MKYDDASWHYGGDFPKDLPDEYSYPTKILGPNDIYFVAFKEER